MKHSRPPAITTTDRIIDTLLAPPFNIVPLQTLDFAAYLCGIEEGQTTGWHGFKEGEHAFILARLENCTNAEYLKEEWVLSRHTARTARTIEELNAKADEWLNWSAR